MSDETILLAMKGLVAPEEGRVLASMAAQVPANLEIVEAGSHRGLSSCWIVSGSMDGLGAHVTCIDPWPEYGSGLGEDVDWAEVGALEQWMKNIDSIGGTHLAKPIRSTAIELAAVWSKPVGMFFHDAGHAHHEVAFDYLAWLPHFAPGTWVGVHDYWGNVADGQGGWMRPSKSSHQIAVDEIILPSGRFTDIQIIGTADGPILPNLWLGRWWPR